MSELYTRSSLVDDSRLSFRVDRIRLVVATVCFVYADGDDTDETTTPFQGVQNTNVGVRYIKINKNTHTQFYTFIQTYIIYMFKQTKKKIIIDNKTHKKKVNLSEN